MSGAPWDPVFFELLDFQQRRIVCYQSRWDKHIVADHPEMADIYKQDAMKAALASPACVTQDIAYSNRHIFYGPAPLGPWYEKRKLIKVVVEWRGKFNQRE
jgi:hypothetical protein